MFQVAVLYESKDRKTHATEFVISGPNALDSIDSIIASFMNDHRGFATVTFEGQEEFEYTFRFNGW